MSDEPAASPIPVPIPKRLDEIIGQELAIGLLSDAMRSERMHHAWIFHGPQGVGKFTTAVAFAAILLDPTAEPGLDGSLATDPESRTQQLLRAGTHPDLHIVVKELARFHHDPRVRDKKLKNIPVEVIRQHLIEPAERTGTLTHTSRARAVFILDEADLLERGGQNALLKTLEEPPAGTVIILVTSNESELLPTVRSRCQRVSFRSLSEGDMKKWVGREKVEIGPESRDFVMGLADGSPGAVLEIVRTGVAEWRKALLPHLSKVMTGRHSAGAAPLMEQMCNEWAEKWVDDHLNASKETANRLGADWMFRVLAHEMRKAVRAGTPGALGAVDALVTAQAQIESNLKGLFVFDNLVSEMAQSFATGS